MQLENKFLVLKIADIEEALIDQDKALLRLLAYKVENYRMGHGKKLNSYVVINQDEPYFPDVLRLMEQNEDTPAINPLVTWTNDDPPEMD